MVWITSLIDGAEAAVSGSDQQMIAVWRYPQCQIMITGTCSQQAGYAQQAVRRYKPQRERPQGLWSRRTSALEALNRQAF